MSDADPQLLTWEQVQTIIGKAPKSLLVGNGLSINVWPQFAYGSLAEAANGSPELEPHDHELIENFGGNFERALSSLVVSEQVLRIANLDEAADELRAMHDRIRNALAIAVHDVRVEWRNDSQFDATLQQIGDELANYQRVYSTNYDVVVYWSILRKNEQGDKDIFKDAFYSHRSEDNTVAFNIADAKTTQKASLVLYPHGALHLVRTVDGTTHKICYTEDARILERFGDLVLDDAVPLLVTEGSGTEKLASIEQTAYLAFALETLGNDDNVLVVFGHRVGSEDEHLAQAAAERPPWRKRTIAVGIYPPAGNVAEQLAHYKKMFAGSQDTLIFFDSRTHPLGDPALQLSPTPPTLPTFGATVGNTPHPGVASRVDF